MSDVTRMCNRVHRQQAQNHNNALIKIDILQDWIAEVSDNHDILMQDLERRLSTARPAHHLPGANGPPPAILDDGSEHIEIQDGSPEQMLLENKEDAAPPPACIQDHEQPTRARALTARWLSGSFCRAAQKKARG